MITLVTGAAGFLGQEVVGSLLRQGCLHVRVHTRQAVPDALLQRWRAAHPLAHVESVQANLLSPGVQLQSLLEGVDCVVHVAAGMKGAAADLFANTVVSTRNLLDAVALQGTRRVVLIGSFAAYKASALAPGEVLDERTPLEETGLNRGAYGYAKTRQEQLFHEYQQRLGFEWVILRPGVIYGPGGGGLSSRVGISAMGLFFSLGGRGFLPLTHVVHCADAVALAALRAPSGSVFNVVDDDLPTCRDFLKRYCKEVQALRCVPVPAWAFMLGARALVAYHRRSQGQLPAVFTPHVVRSMYRPLRYSNAALKSLGWQPSQSTDARLRQTFATLKQALDQPRKASA